MIAPILTVCYTTHTEMPTLYQPCASHAQTLDLKLFQGGYMVVATCLQPTGNLLTTLCQGGSKLGRLLLPSCCLVTTL